MKLPLDDCPYTLYNECTGNEKEVLKLAPIKKGTKLTNNPKNIRLEIRLTQQESNLLRECAERLQVTKTDVINKGIQLVKLELDEK